MEPEATIKAKRRVTRRDALIAFRVVVLVAGMVVMLHLIAFRTELPLSVNSVSAVRLGDQGRSGALSLVWYDKKRRILWAQERDGQREAVLDIAPADAALAEKLAGVRTAAHMPASFAADEAWSSSTPWPEEIGFGLPVLAVIAWSEWGLLDSLWESARGLSADPDGESPTRRRSGREHRGAVPATSTPEWRSE